MVAVEKVVETVEQMVWEAFCGDPMEIHDVETFRGQRHGPSPADVPISIEEVSTGQPHVMHVKIAWSPPGWLYCLELRVRIRL
jgi:hypothetical protein